MKQNTEQIDISTGSLLEQLPTFAERGVTEFSLHDPALAKDHDGLIKVLKAVKKHCPDLFLMLQIDVNVIDQALVSQLQDIYCSLEIPLCGTEKNGTLLFDKKRFASKIALLNNAGIVFGFDMNWAIQKGDTFRAFRERLDFAVSLYPNHIDFAQLSHEKERPIAKNSAVFSSKDIDFSMGIAFACKTFYSEGRAVPWFNTVLHALKITASTFFADFDEWQQCNNCSFITDFNPETTPHIELEKMQLLFLTQKYQEKHLEHLSAAVNDLVTINGAFSRLVSDGTESVIETSYNPDDLLSPLSMDLNSFCEQVTMEPCRVKIFAADDAPDYRIIG